MEASRGDGGTFPTQHFTAEPPTRTVQVLHSPFLQEYLGLKPALEQADFIGEPSATEIDFPFGKFNLVWAANKVVVGENLGVVVNVCVYVCVCVVYENALPKQANKARTNKSVRHISDEKRSMGLRG